jgi:hypothetical protein
MKMFGRVLLGYGKGAQCLSGLSNRPPTCLMVLPCLGAIATALLTHVLSEPMQFFNVDALFLQGQVEEGQPFGLRGCRFAGQHAE